MIRIEEIHILTHFEIKDKGYFIVHGEILL